MLPNTPAALSRLRLSLASGQRRRVGDYLVEQEQREGDEFENTNTTQPGLVFRAHLGGAGAKVELVRVQAG